MPKAGRRICYGLSIIFAGWYAYQHRTVLADLSEIIMLAALITAILSPICTAAERKGMPPAAAAGFSLAFLFCIALVLASVLIPYLASQSADLIRRSFPVLSSLFYRFSSMVDAHDSALLSKTGVLDMMAAYMGRLPSGLANIGFEAASKLGVLCFSLVTSYYLLKERKNLCSHLLLFVPSQWRGAVLSAAQSCIDSIMSYLSAMAKTSLFVAGITYLALLILGVPNALLLALLMGLLEILPYIGPVIASVPILLSCLPLGMSTVTAALALLIVIQQIEGSLVSPYFTASSTSIHPLTALLSVFVFGRLWGIVGILFAVPIVMICRSLLWSFRQVHNLMKA